MSENSFKVKAKKPAPASSVKNGSQSSVKTPAQNRSSSSSSQKLEKARVKKPSSSSRLPEKKLPDVRDLSLMTRDERIRAVLDRPEKKIPKTEKKSAPASSRYEGMKKSIEKSKEKEKEKKDSPVVSSVKPDTSVLLMHLAAGLFILVIILTAVLVISRRGNNSSEATGVQPVLQEAEKVNQGDVTVLSGMSASQVASLLAPYTDSAAFLDYLASASLSGSLQVGTYHVSSEMSTEQIASLLTTPVSACAPVVIYPGYTVENIDSMLANRSFASRGEFIKACRQVMEESGLDFIEGWLMAGTYESSSALDLARQMLNATLDELRSHSAELASSDLSARQVIIIASMVNRETQDASQMPVIAAVMLNRLNSGMPLGIDATTRYELNDWVGKIPQSVYERDTPYNTRRKPGLPPSGIGSISPQAVDAVLNPAVTGALYYLHDDEGKLYTGYTYEEHLETYESVH